MGAPKRCPHTNLKPEALGCHLASKGCAAGEHAELQPHSVKSGRAPPLLDLDLPFGPRGQGRGGLIPLRGLSFRFATQTGVCGSACRTLEEASSGHRLPVGVRGCLSSSGKVCQS